jgi:predicted enzyme related to lactoylglutathione lyase
MGQEYESLQLTLAVPSVAETMAWYEHVFGWHGYCHMHSPEGECVFAAVLWREKPMGCINLSRCTDEGEYSNDGAHFYALLHVDDVDAVYAQVRAAGCKTLSAPQTEIWGGRSFDMLDLNGFRLVFVQWMEDVSAEELQRRVNEEAAG